MAAETITPEQMDAHAPHKTAKMDLWKILGIGGSILTVVAVTFAIVFSMNASQLKEELTTVKMQRTEVEDRMATLLMDKKSAEAAVVPHFYVSGTDVIKVDAFTGEEEKIATIDGVLELIVPWDYEGMIYAVVNPGSEMNSVSKIDVEEETVEDLGVGIGASRYVISADGAYVVGIQNGANTGLVDVLDLKTGEVESLGTLGENELSLSINLSLNQSVKLNDLRCGNVSVFELVPPEDGVEVNDPQYTFKEYRDFCIEEVVEETEPDAVTE